MARNVKEFEATGPDGIVRKFRIADSLSFEEAMEVLVEGRIAELRLGVPAQDAFPFAVRDVMLLAREIKE